MEIDTSTLSAIAAAEIQLKTILALLCDMITATDLNAINTVSGSQVIQHDPRWKEVLRSISVLTVHLAPDASGEKPHKIHKLNYLTRLLQYLLVFESYISTIDIVGYNVIKTGNGSNKTIQEAFTKFCAEQKVVASEAVESNVSIDELRLISIVDLHFEEVYLDKGYRSELPEVVAEAAVQVAQGGKLLKGASRAFH